MNVVPFAAKYNVIFLAQQISNQQESAGLRCLINVWSLILMALASTQLFSAPPHKFNMPEWYIFIKVVLL